MAADGARAPSGEKYSIMCECNPDAAKPGTGGMSILRVHGMQVAAGPMPKTQPCMCSGDEGADVGLNGEAERFP
jgi:hypothetical protein